jgi:hypothetical protein
VDTEDAIWHVLIDDKRHGPLSRAQVLEYLRDGYLAGGDLVWRPGFSDWSQVNQLSEFWQPPSRGQPPPLPPPAQHPERDNDLTAAIASARSNKKVSLWKAANAGLALSAFLLALQVASGRGYELASYAHTASVPTVAALVGQVLGVPLIFVVIAGIVNIFKWKLPSSDASTSKEHDRFRLPASWHWPGTHALWTMVLQQHRTDQRSDAGQRNKPGAACLRSAADIT